MLSKLPIISRWGIYEKFHIMRDGALPQFVLPASVCLDSHFTGLDLEDKENGPRKLPI
jgi:hypothetical protein